MNKESFKITRYSLNCDEVVYCIYLMPNEEDKKFTDFYITEKNGGIISHTIGLEINKLDCSIEEFISENISDWVEIYQNDINILENNIED